MTSRRRSNVNSRISTSSSGVTAPINPASKGEQDVLERDPNNNLFPKSLSQGDDDDNDMKAHRSSSLLGHLVTAVRRYTPAAIARIINPTRLVIGLSLLISHITFGIVAVRMMQQHHPPSSSSFCPSNIIEYINWSGSNPSYQGQVSFRNNYVGAYDSLVRIQPSSEPKTMTSVPSPNRKTFYYDGKKISQPIARAYRSRGWTQVDSQEDAQWIYTYNSNAPWAKDLHPWQRFNYLSDYQKWNSKAGVAFYYKEFEKKTGKMSQYVPETYMLSDSLEDARQFQKTLDEGGARYPWVLKAGNINQGKGITMMAPNSEELLALPQKAIRIMENGADGLDGEENETWEEMIVQKYICNEMTWGPRKFDVRMYWLVASLDPLIVLYHDGYVRIGNSNYNEEDFSDTKAHLTTHTFLGAEGKATFDEFEDYLGNFWNNKGKSQLQLQRMGGSTNSFPWPAKSPVEHVRNQFKDALSEMIEVYGIEAFDVPDGKRITAENAFSFYCADFILDNDLDAWFIEPQNGCGLDEDYYFRLEMHGSLFNGMTDIMEEIWQKQEKGVSVMPLKNVGNWQILYGDGLIYRYQGYQRSTNKASCTTAKHNTNTTTSTQRQ